ncbi:hypothetical protein PTKIN_Ptkin14bG0130000 [Pterospermum kingtungense]
MTESLIILVLDQLLSITRQQARQQLKLVTGVDEEVNNLTSQLHAIKAVLEDAEKRQVNESAVKYWLAQLKDVSYDIDDVLDEWNTAILKREIEPPEETRVAELSLLKKVWSSIHFSCFCVQQAVLRHETALKIEELNKRLSVISNERIRYNLTSERSNHEQTTNITTSVIDESEVFVRVEDEKAIKDMLLCESSTEEKRALRIICVVGMGGIGKTTLTRLAFNDPDVERHFEKRIWVCVSDPFEEQKIAIHILESLVGRKPDLTGKENIMREISKYTSGKKILLVLDDVWTEDSSNWEQLKASLKNSSPESRLLLTTRKKEVGMAMGSRSTTDMFFVGKLSEDKCWSLFSHLAYFERTREERENLEDIGRKIVERCRGLPLAVKTLGSLLRFKTKKHEWQSILDSKMWEIEEVEKGVFPPLLLSYYDLTPVLRQCFSYCAIFPKDYDIEKDRLIKLWMAQGFVKKKGTKGMEIIGEEYFNKLAMRSFFQDFEHRSMISGDVKIYCKMHDIVHDFAQLLTEKECLLIESNGEQQSWKSHSFETVRHLMFMFGSENAAFPIPMDNWKKLHTLLINSDPVKYSSCKENVLNSLIDNLTFLRALEFSVNILSIPQIGRLSDKIGKLIHLRYLNLSNNGDLRILPEAICDLCNLQTLDITRCHRLTELPHGIGKLINLVYLENESTESLRFMPKGMERLTHLRTLKEFVVGNRVYDACSLQGLGKLTHLQGDLKIRKLVNVADTSVAMEARLSAKTGLRKLSLEFNGNNLYAENEAFVLEALQPPPNLESLAICRLYGPTLFPNWMVSLKMLKSVTLSSCAKWESLPPMGKLPFLEYLRIHWLGRVKNVGEEFLGIEREYLGQASSSSSASVTNNSNVGFPNLKSLEFSDLENWEKWEYENICRSHGRGGREESSCITIDVIMPRLQSLSIDRCPKLKALPHHLLRNTPTIQKLYIQDCPILKKRFEEGRGKDWHYISRIPNITITKVPSFDAFFK